MAPNEVNDYDSKRDEAILNGHAYHQNLPPHYIDDDGIPRVTKYADRKARAVVRLVHSIRLRVDLYSDVEQSQAEEVMDTIDGDVGGDDDDDDEFDESNGTGNDSMVCHHLNLKNQQFLVINRPTGTLCSNSFCANFSAYEFGVTGNKRKR
jgi:hypothetical protein